MTIEQLLSFQNATPFHPYRIHLADGRSLEVRHRDFLARSPGGRTAIVYKPNDMFEVIDWLLVTSLETLNGHTGSKKRTRRE